MTVTLDDITRFIGAECSGDPRLPIHGVAPVETASTTDLTFLTNSRYTAKARETKAACIITSKELAAALAGHTCILSTNPHRDLARILTEWFAHSVPPVPGHHPTAVVAPDAMIGADCHIGPFVVIASGARIGARTVLLPYTYVGAGATLGEECFCHPRVTIMDGVRIGHRVVLQPGCVLGADGFGFAPNPPHGYLKMPQIGGLAVGDDVEVQANACIDRGALGDTRIGRGTKVDNLVQIGHNVQIGEHAIIASQTGISGSTTIGNWTTFGGQAGLAGHIHIGDGAIVTAQAGVAKDVPPKVMVSGTPAKPFMESRRGSAEVARIPLLRKRVTELEERLAALEAVLRTLPVKGAG